MGGKGVDSDGKGKTGGEWGQWRIEGDARMCILYWPENRLNHLVSHGILHASDI